MLKNLHNLMVRATPKMKWKTDGQTDKETERRAASLPNVVLRIFPTFSAYLCIPCSYSGRSKGLPELVLIRIFVYIHFIFIYIFFIVFRARWKLRGIYAVAQKVSNIFICLLCMNCKCGAKFCSNWKHSIECKKRLGEEKEVEEGGGGRTKGNDKNKRQRRQLWILKESDAE